MVAAAAFVVFDARRYFTVAEITLPDLIGMPYQQATTLLRREGLDPVTFVEHVVNVAPEAVTSQAPQPGSVVKRGRTIHLGVNTPPAEARLPDLRGLAESAAVARADELNLPLAQIDYAASDQPPGTVVAQEPGGGAYLATGEGIQLTVSSGAAQAPVTIPELTGQDVEVAAQNLRALGFNMIEKLPSAVSFNKPGAVVSVSPAAGETVATSTPIILQYALSAATVVEVPDLAGLPQWRAQLALSAAQLRVGAITYVDDPSRPEGVLEARPTGYTVPGTPILLTINGAAPTSLFPPDRGFTDLPPRGGILTPTPTPGPSPVLPGDVVNADGSRHVPFTFDPTHMGVKRLLEQPYKLQLLVTDDRGERTVLDQMVAAGGSVSTTVAVYGAEALLQTYIDDVFFQAWRP